VKNRVFFRYWFSFASLVLAVVVALHFLMAHAWQKSLAAETERDLRQKTLMFAQRIDSDRQGSLQQITAQQAQAAGARATIIDVNGKVLADSQVDPATSENLAASEEFAAALYGQVGVAKRAANPLGVPILFVAAPIQGGAVRLAHPLTDQGDSTSAFDERSWMAALVTFLLAMPLAWVSARWVTSNKVPGEDLAATQEFRASPPPIAHSLRGAAMPSPADKPPFLPSVAQTKDRANEDEDESDSRQDQQQLETLLNSMQDAVIAVDADGLVQWANRGMEKLTQRVRLQSPLVQTVRDPELLRAVKEATESGTVRSSRAISIVSGKTFDVTAAPLPDGGAVAVLRDLTERERLEKTRRDFIANVSHELRTPLTSIQGYSETLLDTIPSDSAQREFLEIIRKNAARMARLTEDLLALARVESGEKRFELEAVTPEELLRDAAQNFAETASARNLQLEVRQETVQPVMADRDAIHHVFGNLLDNAVKYGSSGDQLILGARPVEGGVEFYVQDFGSGIPSEHLSRLFERFYRVDKARSRESGGTGLGLSIAKHIVLAHGGTIRAESELNHGATFLFTLPSAQDQNPESA